MYATEVYIILHRGRVGNVEIPWHHAIDKKFGNRTGSSTHFSNRNSFQEEAIINCRNSVTNSQSTNFVTFESLP